MNPPGGRRGIVAHPNPTGPPRTLPITATHPLASGAMRRAPTLLTSLAALLLVACGGGDDDTASTTFTPGPSPDTTVPVIITVAPGTCEDVPEPASYPDGQVPPPVIPPCDVPAELAVHTIRAGVGRAAEPGDVIVIDYTGLRSDDGAVFDSSYERDAPFDFPLGRGDVIAGWDQGLVGAQAGALMKLDIPADLAYADTPPAGGVIRAGDALSFVVEVRAVIAPTVEADAPLDLRLTPSIDALGVTTEDVVVGEGAVVGEGDTAVVHMLIVRGDNQVVLFNSWGRNDPVQVVMTEGGSLPGVLEGLAGARVGTQRIIAMPPELAFGADGNPGLGLPAGVDVIVVTEVVGVY